MALIDFPALVALAGDGQDALLPVVLPQPASGRVHVEAEGPRSASRLCGRTVLIAKHRYRRAAPFT